jgi:hypothetical protein
MECDEQPIELNTWPFRDACVDGRKLSVRAEDGRIIGEMAMYN